MTNNVFVYQWQLKKTLDENEHFCQVQVTLSKLLAKL